MSFISQWIASILVCLGNLITPHGDRSSIGMRHVSRRAAPVLLTPENQIALYYNNLPSEMLGDISVTCTCI
jgi:hypothetical protein